MKKRIAALFFTVVILFSSFALFSCSETEDLIEGEDLLPDMSTDDFRDENGVVRWPAELLPEGFPVPQYETLYAIERDHNVVNITAFAYQDLAKHIWPVIDLKGSLYESGFMAYYDGNGNYLGQHFYDQNSKTDVIIYEFPYDELLYGVNEKSPTDYTYRLEIKKTRLPFESLGWIYPDPVTDVGLSAAVFDEWPSDYLPEGFFAPDPEEFSIVKMEQKPNGVFITFSGNAVEISKYEYELKKRFSQIDRLQSGVEYSGSGSLSSIFISKNGDYFFRKVLSLDTKDITDPDDDTETVEYQICKYNEYVIKPDIRR